MAKAESPVSFQEAKDSILEFINSDPRFSHTILDSTEMETRNILHIHTIFTTDDNTHKLKISLLSEYETICVDHSSKTVRFSSSTYDRRTFKFKKIVVFLEKEGVLVMPYVMKKG